MEKQDRNRPERASNLDSYKEQRITFLRHCSASSRNESPQVFSSFCIKQCLVKRIISNQMFRKNFFNILQLYSEELGYDRVNTEFIVEQSASPYSFENPSCPFSSFSPACILLDMDSTTSSSSCTLAIFLEPHSGHLSSSNSLR